MAMDAAAWSSGTVAEALQALAKEGGRVALDVRSGKKRWIFYLDGGALVGTVSNLKSEQGEAMREAAGGAELDDDALSQVCAVRRLVNATKSHDGERKLHEGAAPKVPEALGLGDVLAAAWAEQNGQDAVKKATAELVAAWPRLRGELVAEAWAPASAAWLSGLQGQQAGAEVLEVAPGGAEVGRTLLAQAQRMGLVVAGVAPQAMDAAGLPELDLGSLLADIKEDTGGGGSDAFHDGPSGVSGVRQAAGSAPPVVSVNVPAGHPMADQLTALGQRIDRAEDHFQVLDMPWDANPGSFRSAYVTLAQQLHPDRYTDAPAVLQDRATGLFDKVREAWEVLGNDEQRQAYIDKVVHGKKSEQELAMEQINAYWSAEADFKRGLAAFKNGRISQAHPAFRAASDAVPDELEWKAYHAYTTFHVNRTREPQKAEDAVEMLKNVLEANKAQERKLDSGWVLLGKTYRDRSMPDAAKRCFVQALRYNPSNADAQLELRRMKGDSDKDKGGGFFSKLFGKK